MPSEELLKLEAKTELLARIGITAIRDTTTGEPVMWSFNEGDCLTPEDALICYLEELKCI